jgi:L-ribulokinase
MSSPSSLDSRSFSFRTRHCSRIRLGTGPITRSPRRRFCTLPFPATGVKEKGVNGGGIPQNNQVLNQIYANVLAKTVLVPEGAPTSIGAAIFAFSAAGVFNSIQAASEKFCLPFKKFKPQPAAVARYERLYELYRKLYFGLGTTSAPAVAVEIRLPELRSIAEEARRS